VSAMRINQAEGLPIKMWLDDIEPGAMAQAHSLANLPFAFKHIAIMPDAHQGYGMPIGGVLATKGVVIPNAVGVDIGCGMCAMKTSLSAIDPPQLKRILSKIRQHIPMGFSKHQHGPEDELMPEYVGGTLPGIVDREYENARRSLGTLGGGNHFIEFQTDGEHIWVMIHSGSRNLGKQVADHYNKLAKKLNAQWYTSVPTCSDLAFFPLTSEEGQAYLTEMDYCVRFALANRNYMMDRIYEIMFEVLGPFDRGQEINIAHNYARMENHFGTNVMIHRKGATSAADGEEGIIPGSQGTCSYIVRGLGNRESFRSCSHGAGRKMSRKRARNVLDLEHEQNVLEGQGIIHSVRNVTDLDEAPGAYKDIEEVMAHQKDLVEITTKLHPIAVLKG